MSASVPSTPRKSFASAGFFQTMSYPSLPAEPPAPSDAKPFAVARSSFIA